MLLKTADDKTADLVELERLLALPLSRRQQEDVSRQITNIQRGIAGERDAAYHIDHFFHDSDQTIVIHDLRLDLDGEVAQIDHLLLTRFRMVYVLETKNFGGRLYCSPDGNWKCYYGAGKGVGYDIASPTEQARRHCKTLERWFKANGLTVFDRVDWMVLIPPDKAKPKLTGMEAERVIKTDNLRRWWQDQREFGGTLGTLWRVATRVSLPDLEKVGQALLEDHVPSQRDWRARFGIAPGLQPAGAQPEARASRELTPAPKAPTVSPIEPAPAPQASSVSTEQEEPAPLASPVSPDTPAVQRRPLPRPLQCASRPMG